MTDDKPPFRRSLETDIIIERLKTARRGELVSYSELEKLIGHPVEGNTPWLRTAIERMEKDEDRIIKPDKGRGVVWLDDDGIVEDARERTRSIRRQSMRTVERISKVDYSAMSPTKQREHSMLAAANMTVAFMTKPKQLQRIEAAIQPGRRELPVSETLKMFASREE